MLYCFSGSFSCSGSRPRSFSSGLLRITPSPLQGTSQITQSQRPSSPGRKTPMLVKFDNGHWANPCDAECPRLAGMRNVRVRNLRVFADEGVGKPLIKVWSSGPQAGLRPFGPYEGIVFDGIFVNGRPVDKSDLALEVNMPIEMVKRSAGGRRGGT